MRFDILAKLDYKRCHFESCPTNWRLACHASFSTSLDDMFWNKIPSGIIGHRNEVYPPFFQFIYNLTCYFKINLSISTFNQTNSVDHLFTITRLLGDFGSSMPFPISITSGSGAGFQSVE